MNSIRQSAIASWLVLAEGARGAVGDDVTVGELPLGGGDPVGVGLAEEEAAFE